jgi:ABC-type glycerol-3-phosphate transport system substrate-binding protein
MPGKELAAIGGCLALAGCGLSSVAEQSPSSRCAEALKLAVPKTEIEITGTTGNGDPTQDLNTIRTTAEGRPKDGKGAPLAIECVFHDGILVSVRWLVGQEAAK